MYMSGVTAVEKPDVVSTNPTVAEIIYIFLDSRYHIPVFQQEITEFFRQNLEFFDNWAFFFKKIRFGT